MHRTELGGVVIKRTAFIFISTFSIDGHIAAQRIFCVLSSFEFRRSHASSGVIQGRFPEGGHHVHNQQRHGSAPTSSIESRETKVGQPKISREHHSSLMRRELSEGIQNRQGPRRPLQTEDRFPKVKILGNSKSTGMSRTSPSGRN